MRVVNSLEDARMALREGEGCGTFHLISPPFAACHAGVNYYRYLLDQLRTEFPAADVCFTLCCGDDPAIAHDALRMGFMSVICDCAEAQFAELQRVANALGRTAAIGDHSYSISLIKVIRKYYISAETKLHT